MAEPNIVHTEPGPQPTLALVSAPSPGCASPLKQFESYLRLEKRASENTISSYLLDLEKFQTWLTARGMSVEQAQRQDIQQYMATIMAEGLSARSAARKLSTLRSFYGLLLDDERVRTNPTKGVPIPKIGKALPRFLELSELEEMVRWTRMQGDPLYIRDTAILLVLFASGLRESELVNLKVTDLHLDAGIVKVWNGKGGKDGIAPLSPPAIKALGFYLRIIRPKLERERSPYVFLPGGTNSVAPKMTRQALFYRIRDIGRKALGRDVRPHEFRHGCATALVNGGADIRDVAAVLRHSDINTTQIYTHLDLTYLRGIYGKSHPRA